jgi:hypothetical protein
MKHCLHFFPDIQASGRVDDGSNIFHRKALIMQQVYMVTQTSRLKKIEIFGENTDRKNYFFHALLLDNRRLIFHISNASKLV